MDEIEGIVVSDIDYRDSSKIITVLCNRGLVGIIAKGCKSPKSKLRSCCDKMTYGKFYIKYKENKLSTLNNFDSYYSFKNIKNDFVKLGFSMYLLDLCYQVCKDSFNESIYYNLIDALKKIDNNINPLMITNILEIKCLFLLGVGPILDRCASCASTNNIVGLSSNRGGLVCSNCFHNDMLLDERSIKLIRLYSLIDISKIDSLNVSKSIVNDVNRFIDDYYDKYTGLYLNGKKIVCDIFNRM